MITNGKTRRSISGVTLVEVMLSVAILGITAMMGKIVVDFINNLFQQNALLAVNRDMQLQLYSISRDVRNSIGIVELSSATLVLSMVNVSKGYDTTTNPTLFDQANLSTVTYQYVTVGNDGYLRRRYQYGGGTLDKIYLKNLLFPADTSYYIFGDPYRPSGSQPPYDSVEIVLRPKPVYKKEKVHVYRSEAMKRTPS